MTMDVTSNRFLMLAAACALCGQLILADSRADVTPNSKTKRNLNIIGPIPTSYRGQATGKTTFDGIQADDLQLPTTDFSGFRAQSASDRGYGPLGAQSSVSPTPTDRSGQFQAESRPDVYNFDGKEDLTYDGVLASDLMVPYAHVTVLNPMARSAQPQYFRQRLPQTTVQRPVAQQFHHRSLQPVVRQANFPDNYRDNLIPPTPSPNLFQTFQQAGTVPRNADPSPFQPETPSERYNRLQQQYQATLAEYRNSLIRFQEQLRKYSSFSKKK